VVFFSHWEYTLFDERNVREIKGELLELTLAMPYLEEDGALMDQVQEEVRTSVCLPLIGQTPSIEDHNTLFIGTPNWCGGISPPVRSFPSHGDFAGKRAAPFCTHGEAGNIRRDTAKLCRNAVILSELSWVYRCFPGAPQMASSGSIHLECME
jgi:hypothetical protein